MSALLTGIDVSADNGAVPWASYHGKISFAFIRGTTWTGADTFGTDPRLATNAAATFGLWDGKLPRGYYHETRPATSIPRAQARGFIRCVAAELLPGDMLAVAMGDNGGQGSMGPAALAAWHAEFFRALFDYLGTGHRALAYCNPSYAKSGACEGLGHHPLWLADYGVGDAPGAPGPWTRWEFLQDRSAPAPDHDVYRGSAAELAAFANMPPYRL